MCRQAEPLMAVPAGVLAYDKADMSHWGIQKSMKSMVHEFHVSLPTCMLSLYATQFMCHLKKLAPL